VRVWFFLGIILSQTAFAAPNADPKLVDLWSRMDEFHAARGVQRAVAPSELKRAAPDAALDALVARFLDQHANTGLLIWEARDGDDDQWLYLPGVKKVKRIAASGKKNRFLGTDFAFEDMRPEALAAHRYESAGSETLEGQDCWVIEAFPATERQAADSGYSKRKLWVRKDITQIVKREYYDTKGRLEKVQTDRRLVNVRGALWRADEIEMHDVQSNGRTVLTLEKRALDTGLKDSFFTETELAHEGT